MVVKLRCHCGAYEQMHGIFRQSEGLNSRNWAPQISNLYSDLNGVLHVLRMMLQVWDISDSTFKSNTALEGGGGICGVNGIDMTVINSEFSSNYANREGGAINLQVSTRLSSSH